MAIEGVKISEFNSGTAYSNPMDNATSIFLASYKTESTGNVNHQICLNDIKTYIDNKLGGNYYTKVLDSSNNERIRITNWHPANYGAALSPGVLDFRTNLDSNFSNINVICSNLEGNDTSSMLLIRTGKCDSSDKIDTWGYGIPSNGSGTALLYSKPNNYPYLELRYNNDGTKKTARLLPNELQFFNSKTDYQHGVFDCEAVIDKTFNGDSDSKSKIDGLKLNWGSIYSLEEDKSAVCAEDLRTKYNASINGTYGPIGSQTTDKTEMTYYPHKGRFIFGKKDGNTSYNNDKTRFLFVADGETWYWIPLFQCGENPFPNTFKP